MCHDFVFAMAKLYLLVCFGVHTGFLCHIHGFGKLMELGVTGIIVFIHS